MSKMLLIQALLCKLYRNSVSHQKIKINKQLSKRLQEMMQEQIQIHKIKLISVILINTKDVTTKQNHVLMLIRTSHEIAIDNL